MRVATVDGLVTLFYDGSKPLYNRKLHREWWWEKYNDHDRNDDNWESSDECKRYWRERQSWQQVIIEEGVTEIPDFTFYECFHIQRVVFSNTVIRIKGCAFWGCERLVYIKWSINLEVIEGGVFYGCNLSSVFIPPRCRVIGHASFRKNCNLAIFNVPQETEIDVYVIAETKLINGSHFQIDERGEYDSFHGQTEDVVGWIKNINNGEKYSLHRACASFQPLKEVLLAIIEEKGVGSFSKKNSIGITPSRYLKENAFAEVTEKDIIRDYIMKMMGE